jgi:hypothetical protein
MLLMGQPSRDPLTVLKRFVARFETQRAAARDLKISQAYLHDLLNARREFSGPMLEKLGLERVVVEKRA